MSNSKTYRIKTNEGEQYVDINLNINQDIDMFEMLSLKIGSKNLYRLQTSNYGCVAGRVLANNAIGVPNVKLSIFIAADESTKEDSVLNALYPYSNTFDKNSDGVVYNLLTEEEVSECQVSNGTFPSKRLVLDDGNVFEVFDKYYKFTTTTNFAGDYMIFGIPVGTQSLHVDVDLSDIGNLLSQTPRDFIYKGYDRNLFESPSQFKKSNDLGSLPQIITQNESVYVYPFWGDASEMKENDSNGVRISRKDINLSYKFEPTCIFFGSIISDEKSNGFSEKCVPTDRMGKMDKLTAGEGTIEMIRKTPDGDVESYNISGTHLIDGDGTWCYQIPMNLDFVRTDENGNIVPSDDPNKGLPTRTRVRFRFSLNDFASDYENNHLCKMLVPNNPTEPISSTDTEKSYYTFGTFTREEDFRDLLWNKVYSVKSYIPRIQKSDFDRERRFSGIKCVNVNGNNNPFPYNNIRINITFLFLMQCAIFHAMVWIVTIYNKFISFLLELLVPQTCSNLGKSTKDHFSASGSCLTIGDGLCEDVENWYFAPGCKNTWIQVQDYNDWLNPLYTTFEHKLQRDIEQGIDKKSIDYKNKDSDSSQYCLTNKIDYFMQCVEISLAQEYEVIQFDFYNDWMNGVLYIPRWFAKVRKAKSILFGIFKIKEKVLGCMEESFNIYRRYTQQCSLSYEITGDTKNVSNIKIKNHFGCHYSKDKCHKKPGRNFETIFKKVKWTPGGGIVHPQKTYKEESAYYFRPRDFRLDNNKRFATFFATDIILLGSIVENDIDGIPYISELISSTFKMPTNLAATNLDKVASMYGSNVKDTVCKGGDSTFEGYAGDGADDNSMSGVTLTKDTFENYAKWAGPYYISTTNDETEYPITEASGIDWGYTGPEQSDIYETMSSDRKKYFKPGGIFLGISCFYSETTVFSCLNLSRICEIGVGVSRRKVVEKKSNELYNLYVIPNGLITNYDIYDGDFRSVFATLNHNELHTVKDDLSGRYLYDIIPMHVEGFEGSMKYEYYKWEDTVYTSDNIETRRVFSKTNENFDKTYYDFRMGLNNYKNLISSYTYLVYDREEDVYQIPMYNNSFYFYFGLHDGATALDKFHEKFYGTCNITDE